jgi:CRP-like cAMP-binding protein
MVVLRASAELLRRVPLFSSLGDDQLQRVISSPKNAIVEYRPLETIIAEDEVADCMFIILDGTCDVRIKAVGGREITIATLKAGEFFGEQALLPGATGRRNASVRALQPCRLFRITKDDVLLGTGQPVDDTRGAPDLPPPSEDERVRMLLQTVNLFRSLSPRDLERVGDWTEVVRFDAGDIIVREAEQGDFMYVVLEGSVEVFVLDDDGKIVVLARLTRGHYFGEQALLPNSTGVRNANVRADGAVMLVRVAKRYFQLIVNHDNKLMLALKAVGDAQRKKIMSALGQEPH